MKMRLRKCCVLQLEWKLKTVPVSIFVDDLWLCPFHSMNEETFFYCKLHFFLLFFACPPCRFNNNVSLWVKEKKSSSSIVGVIQQSKWNWPDSGHDRQVQCHNFLLSSTNLWVVERLELNSDTNLWQFSVARRQWKLIRLIVHKINMQLSLNRVISIALTQKNSILLFSKTFIFMILSKVADNNFITRDFSKTSRNEIWNSKISQQCSVTTRLGLLLTFVAATLKSTRWL